MTDIYTDNKVTWCPGCPDFMVMAAVNNAVLSLITQGCKREEFVAVADIGCGSKIYDYLSISGMNGLHGRVVPTAFGIHVGNPKLKVMAFGGDGGVYNEGMGHFVHACRYNPNITLIVFDNQVFSLTTCQSTATSEIGFIEKTHPFGIKEMPLNPLVLALELGATFVSRVSALDLNQMSEVIEEAVKHEGFSLIEVLQPCLSYHDFSDFLKKNAYKIEPMGYEMALKEAKKWNYNEHEGGKVATGIFFKERKPTFEEKYLKKPN